MTFTKTDKAHLDSPCQELSCCGPGIVVALLVCSGKLIFRVFLLVVQSSCMYLLCQPPCCLMMTGNHSISNRPRLYWRFLFSGITDFSILWNTSIRGSTVISLSVTKLALELSSRLFKLLLIRCWPHHCRHAQTPWRRSQILSCSYFSRLPCLLPVLPELGLLCILWSCTHTCWARQRCLIQRLNKGA